ncbi:MAG: YfiR family protein [Bacteroidota bacterium]
MLLLLFSGSTASGQHTDVNEYQVKAVFLYNFTQFIDWPATSFNTPEEPFVIGIIGENPFGFFLDEVIAGEKFGTHPIIVKKFEEIHDISNCHILYINSSDAIWVGKILSSVSDKNMLTVSDAPNFSKVGGMVRFFTENKKIRLQINVERSKASRLNISSKLLSVSKTN